MKATRKLDTYMSFGGGSGYSHAQNGGSKGSRHESENRNIRSSGVSCEPKMSAVEPTAGTAPKTRKTDLRAAESELNLHAP